MLCCWIAQGKLFIRSPDGSVTEHQSEFAREAQERHAEQRRQQGWKAAADPSARGLIDRRMLWAGQARDQAHAAPARFLTVLPSADGKEVYYVLGLSRSTGLFRYHLGERHEVRLFHRQEFIQLGLAWDAHAGGLLAGVRADDGSASIWQMDGEGRLISKLTDGDVVDSSPSVSRRRPSDVLYESSGIGRNSSGEILAHAPTSIQRLDRQSGAVSTVREDARWDYLQPNEDQQGRILCIRRPYRDPHHVSPWAAVKDVLLFPLRLVVAVFAFLNVFSVMFAKRPLKTAGMPQPFDARPVVIKGQLVDAQRLARMPPERRALVPGNWQLLRILATGQEQVLASKVVSYALNPDGSILTTDGFAIRRLEEGGETLVLRSDLVEHLASC